MSLSVGLRIPSWFVILVAAHSQLDSLHTGKEWIIFSTSCSILSVKGSFIFALSCSWFELVFNIGWYDKSYCKLALLSHPDKNKNPQYSTVMRMINESKEVSEDIFRYNDAMREKECVHTAQKHIEILSDSSSSSSSDESLETSYDDSSPSGKRQKSTKPMTSSNKSSIFTAKHKSDNEETSFKQPLDAFTSKQKILERIKRLHITFGLLGNKHLFMRPINWLNHREAPDVNA